MLHAFFLFMYAVHTPLAHPHMLSNVAVRAGMLHSAPRGLDTLHRSTVIVCVVVSKVGRYRLYTHPTM